MSNTHDEKNIWERLPTDTSASFDAFCVYRDMGTYRSLAKAADKYYSALNRSASLRQFETWSSKHAWVERCGAYDAHLDEMLRNEWNQARLDQRQKRQQLVSALGGLLGRVMAQHQGELDPRTLNSLASAASKILDQSRQEFNDLPAQRTELTGANGGPIQTDNKTTFEVHPEDIAADLFKSDSE